MNVPKALNVQERSATFAKVLEYEAFNVRYFFQKNDLYRILVFFSFLFLNRQSNGLSLYPDESIPT